MNISLQQLIGFRESPIKLALHCQELDEELLNTVVYICLKNIA